MILCEDVRPRPGNARKLDVFGLLTNVRSNSGDFPAALMFSVYLVLTAGRGRGVGRIRVRSAETDERIYDGDDHTLQFSSDPLKLLGVSIRVARCLIPAA